VTLTRLVLAWLPAALWLGATAYGLEPPETRHAAAAAGAAESVALTLVAALWFDSLGHGGWWLLFLLFGVLRTVPAAPFQRPRARGVAATLARYVGAGAILAWRLG
jgi:hypothetical protein